MTNFAGIVRWLPLVVVTAACSADGPTAPEGVDASLLVTANAANGSGSAQPRGRWTNGEAHLGNFSVSEQRLWHARYYPDPADESKPGVYRICYLNPFENQDGSNWKNGEAKGGHLHINEPNAFVMIKERPATEADLYTVDGITLPRPVGAAYGEPFDAIPPITLKEVKEDGTSAWRVTYVGRGQWTSNGFLYAGGKEISRRSLLKGVVAPAPAYMSEVGALASEGLWSSDNGHDLMNVLLGPAQSWTQRIDELLAETYLGTPGHLRFVECDVDFYWKVVHNEVLTTPGVPGGLLQLIPGAK